jgi:hypothetical protein
MMTTQSAITSDWHLHSNERIDIHRSRSSIWVTVEADAVRISSSAGATDLGMLHV